jgi:DNA adenine methylase
MDPFLPWPGSKAKCAAAIISEFPKEVGTYHEPFLGSGSIFFGLNKKVEFKEARLSDKNKNLIGCWDAVHKRPFHVQTMLRHCLERNSEEFFYRMRSQMENPSVFLYVMRAAFSSLYRENSKGEFNVPWRKQDYTIKKKTIGMDTERIIDCSMFMQSKNVAVFVADYLDSCQDVRAGDLVYFDPPYLPYTETGFVNYVAGGFNEGDHVFLRTQCRLLAEKGAFVALSNSDVPASRRLYGEPAKLINVSNSVKSTAKTKGTRAEGLWIWRPKGV